MQDSFFLLASLSGASAVALGAFGAHALHRRLSPDQLVRTMSSRSVAEAADVRHAEVSRR
jgi:uncharacterized membrane protein YgdD (TMEM256/DUF423 family)